MSDAALRNKALIGIAWQAAHDNIGCYPASFNGVPRSERQDGWNDCSKSNSDHYFKIRHWLKEIPPEHKAVVEDMLLDGVCELNIVDDFSVSLMVNCNDLFFWGCSDAEDISVAELPDLALAISDAKAVGAETGGELLWVARKRGCRPQGAYYAHVSPELANLFDTCGPFRKAELGNPVASSFEAGEVYRRKRKLEST